MEKVVLAYSGGLDTSVILKWLINKGYEVVAYVADVGQQEDFEKLKHKALALGASKVYIEDLKESFVKDYIFTALKGSVIYEDGYLLGTALARPLIAKRQVEIAWAEKACYVAHGATGKGNDQVRFELGYKALAPTIKVIAPWRQPEFLDRFKGRSDLLAYAKLHDIKVEASTAAPYSIDANLMHTSYESGVLEDPGKAPPLDMCKGVLDPREAPDVSSYLVIEFKQGVPVKVSNLDDKSSKSTALELFMYLNEIGAANGIGTIDIVENRYIGLKSRGIYESPGASILWKAHQALEGICLDKEVLRIKTALIPKVADVIYNGYWFSPEMNLFKDIFDATQKSVTGSVKLALYKGNISVLARESEQSLYSEDLVSMDKEGGFDQKDSDGFIKVNSIRLQVHHQLQQDILQEA